MSIITKDEVKTYLQISTTDYDDRIELLIPDVEAWVKLFCNDEMKDEEGNDSYPLGIKRVVAVLLSEDLFSRGKIDNNIVQETLGDYSVTFSSHQESNGYSNVALGLLTPFIKTKQTEFFKVKFI